MSATTDNPWDLTPIEERGDILVKRDDLFMVAGQRGGKARAAYQMMVTKPQPKGVVTAGSRHSPQVGIVANIAKMLDMPCSVHVPAGPDTPEIAAARLAGAEVIAERPGHNSVIISRAKAGAQKADWMYIPFGMETAYALDLTRHQVANVPLDGTVKRIVVPVGSAMTLCGVLWGLNLARGLARKPDVLGVRVGADPSVRLAKYSPPWWDFHMSIVRSELAYDERPAVTEYGCLQLDPLYEAKCIPFLQPGDLLWVVGYRSVPEGDSEA